MGNPCPYLRIGATKNFQGSQKGSQSCDPQVNQWLECYLIKGRLQKCLSLVDEFLKLEKLFKSLDIDIDLVKKTLLDAAITKYYTIFNSKSRYYKIDGSEFTEKICKKYYQRVFVENNLNYDDYLIEEQNLIEQNRLQEATKELHSSNKPLEPLQNHLQKATKELQEAHQHLSGNYRDKHLAHYDNSEDNQYSWGIACLVLPSSNSNFSNFDLHVLPWERNLDIDTENKFQVLIKCCLIIVEEKIQKLEKKILAQAQEISFEELKKHARFNESEHGVDIQNKSNGFFFNLNLTKTNNANP